ncbi:uncharacterized protein LOC135502658 isoform X3 [Lineus longissimus]|uniref:uncharacterized protein LOC135502658 isoform X3 n=1 Tax=Lineus longissimus TaxID=88925 RepID=UPI00315DB167
MKDFYFWSQGLLSIITIKWILKISHIAIAYCAGFSNLLFDCLFFGLKHLGQIIFWKEVFQIANVDYQRCFSVDFIIQYDLVMTNKREKVPYSHHVITTLLFISLILNCANAAPSYSVNVSPTTVGIGDSVTLSCRITDPSGFTVQWRKDINGEFKDVGTATKNGCIFNAQLDSTNYRWDICGAATNISPRDYNLKIIKARPADAGTWDCLDIGKGTPSDRVEVKVQVPPLTPTVTGLDKPVGVGTKHTLTCDAHQPGISNSIAYTWYKDNIAKATLSDLSFNPVSKADAGSYRCEAKNAVATTTSKSLDFEVYYPPNTITLSSTKSVRPLNQRESFTCMTSGSNPPNPILTIYRDKGGKKELLTGTGPTILLNDRRMAKSDNQAKFYCESSVSGYPSMFKKSNEITYTVYYPHTVTLLTNSTRTVVAGTTFTLTCNATGGNPENVKQYRWTRNGKTLQSTSRVYYRYDVKYDDGGNYGCTATNDGGSTSDSINITVNYPPIWNPALPEVLTTTATLNRPAKFTLHVIANPVATVATWFRYHSSTNFTALDSDFTPAKVNETTYTLEIKSVKQDYFGQYKVDVTSPTGPSAFIFKLTPPGKPNPPCCLNVTMVTSKSVTLTFKAGFFGGSEQTFTVEFRESSGSWSDAETKVADPGTDRIATVKISDLKEETGYEFRVCGKNSFGRSEYSDIAGTETDAAPPISDDEISIIRKDATITISWPALGREYTKIEIKYCVIRGENRGVCVIHEVKDTSVTMATITVEEGKEYGYTMTIYDDGDTVFISAVLASRTELPVVIIAGGAAGGGVLLLIIIIITAVCISKKRKEKKEKGDVELHRVIRTSSTNNDPASAGSSKKFHIFAKPHAKNTLRRKYQDTLVVEDKGRKRGSMDIGQINPGYENDFKQRDEARKDSLASILDKGHFAYEDVSINNYCPKMTSNESAEHAEVELRTPDTTRMDALDGGQEKLDLSAIINKPTKAPPMAEYAQVDFTKKTRPNNLNEPPGTKVNNSDINKGAVYADVDLSKKSNRQHLTVDNVSMDGTDQDQSFEIKIRVKVPSPKPGHKAPPLATAPKPKSKAKPAGSTYENTDIRTNINDLNCNSSEDGAYANTGGDNIYQEVGVGQTQKPPMVGVDGTIYADVNLMNQKPSKPVVIKETEPSSEYAQVDFGRKAPSMTGNAEKI